MKSTVLLSSFAFLFGGLALVFAWNAEPSNRAAEAKALERAPVPTAELEARLDELSEENRLLRDRLAMIESGAVQEERTPIAVRFASQAEFEMFRDEVRDALAGMSSGGPLASSLKSPEFRDQLTDTLGEIRQTEAEVAIQQKRDARFDGLDTRMPKLEAQLGLTGEQSTLMRAALAAQIDRQAELSRRYTAGEDAAVLGELKLSDYNTHQEELAGFLTEEQLTTYRGQGRGGK
tara:strand:+ start:2252 stop:2953 length:702 start_codon:yes stop_codon:yes gene_type:complete